MNMLQKLNTRRAYFFRDELDLRHKLINSIILAMIAAQLPILISFVITSANLILYVVDLILLALCVLFFIFVNKYVDSDKPLIIFVCLVDYLVIPALFFTGGGRKAGSPLWMILGFMAIVVLLTGAVRNITTVINIIVAALCYTIEYLHPEYITYYQSEFAEMIDSVFSLYLVVVVVGGVVGYEMSVYEKQVDMLNVKDKSITEANTHLEELNSQLKSASEAKSNFLANMSHEIRTPINAVIGMNEMILRECNDDTILSYAEDIDSASHQLLSLINDILDFSKIESGKIELHPSEYEMFSVINDCYNMIIMRAKKKELRVKVENNPKVPAFLYGDEVRVRQIIMNLLTNAVKYTKDGYVQLSVDYEKRDEDSIILKISVKDTGIGISEENIKLLFNEFQRVDEFNNRTIEGTGLGLVITKRFIEMMNGTITVDSKLHEGSVFTVEIPQKIANEGEMGEFSSRYKHKDYLDENAIKERVASESRITGPVGMIDGEQVTGASKLRPPKADRSRTTFVAPNARILVVDDVKMNLNVVRLLLKNTQIEVDMAEGGEQALSYTMLKHYDVIFMDHMMPGMDGIETLHNIRKQNMGLNLDTPVVALTANAIASVEEMYISEGFVSYISKPVKFDKLEAVLMKLLPKDKVTRVD